MAIVKIIKIKFQKLMQLLKRPMKMRKLRIN